MLLRKAGFRPMTDLMATMKALGSWPVAAMAWSRTICASVKA